ncbi:MAG: serine--tRNA ligase [Alphaproteobacteria bacterium]|nr:serine--tRNA ligase [Alphaproteobacteria bacterium]
MFDLRFIRNSPDLFDAGLVRRGQQPLSASILELDEQHRTFLTGLQTLQACRNQLAKDFGKTKREGGDVSALTEQSEEIKEKISELEGLVQSLEGELHTILSELPNTPALDCPDGKSEDDNIEIRRIGTPRQFAFTPLNHDELGESLGLMDFERAAKLSGARFVVLYDGLARLERALATFMLDIHTTEFGYQEVYVPLLVKDAALFGTGQLPKFQDDLFQTMIGESASGHWLIPTSEVALTNLVAGEILSEAELPLRYTAYTPCFRAEAGAAGRDTRGMIRQHQFGKVEMVSITTPEQSVAEHERMTTAAETVLQRLGLPYRVVALCTGDIGFCAEKTYDLDVWLPGQNAYREISSCSRCHTFQARRMNARYRPGGGDNKPQFVHTLNGSGVAVGRALVAIMENYQESDGSIAIPDVLVPYMGGVKKLERRQN